MSLKDKFIIGLIIVFVIIFGVFLRAKADGIYGWIFNEGVYSDYYLASFAQNNRTDFIHTDYDPNWKDIRLHINNVTSIENLGATISSHFAACVNEGLGTEIDEDYTKGSEGAYKVVNVLDIRWDNTDKKYKIYVDGEEKNNEELAMQFRLCYL